MGPIVSMNLANAIVKLVAADALPALVGNLVMGNLVQRSFEPEVKQVGDTVPVPTSDGTKQVSLDSHIEASFQIPDVTKVIACPDLLDLYMTPAIEALTAKLEQDLGELAAGMDYHAPITGGTMTGIDLADDVLLSNGVYSRRNKLLVVDPATWRLLRKDPGFSEYTSAGAAGLKVLIDGPVGVWGPWFIFRSANLVKREDGDGFYCPAFTRETMGLVMRRLGQPIRGTGLIAEYAELGNFGMRVLMDYKPDTLAQTFTIDLLYGKAVVMPRWGLVLKSGGEKGGE